MQDKIKVSLPESAAVIIRDFYVCAARKCSKAVYKELKCSENELNGKQF